MLEELMNRICLHGRNVVFQANEKSTIRRSAHNYLLFLINRELNTVQFKRLRRMLSAVQNAELANAFDELCKSDFSDDFPLFEKSHCSRVFDKNLMRAILYQRSKKQFIHELQKSRKDEIKYLQAVLLPLSFQLVSAELTINKIML